MDPKPGEIPYVQVWPEKKKEKKKKKKKKKRKEKRGDADKVNRFAKDKDPQQEHCCRGRGSVGTTSVVVQGRHGKSSWPTFGEAGELGPSVMVQLMAHPGVDIQNAFF